MTNFSAIIIPYVSKFVILNPYNTIYIFLLDLSGPYLDGMTCAGLSYMVSGEKFTPLSEDFSLTPVKQYEHVATMYPHSLARVS
jgi:hypothetical protein